MTNTCILERVLTVVMALTINGTNKTLLLIGSDMFYAVTNSHLLRSITSGNQAFSGLMITCEMFSYSVLFQESLGSVQNCIKNK